MMRRRWKWVFALAVVGGCDQGAGDRSPDSGNEAVVAAVPEPTATAEGDQGYEQPRTGGPQSRFTSLDVAKCRLIERNDEEAGYARHRCVGAAGYGLELVESDLRQTIEVIAPDGTKQSLDLSSLVAGGGFSSVGKTADWRGTDPAQPRTLTIRYGVNEDPDPEVAPRSYLVVAKLASPACVIARVAPGPRQSAEARAIADNRRLPPCLRR